MDASIQQDDSKTIFLALFSDAFQVFLQGEVAFYFGLCSAVDGSFVKMSVFLYFTKSHFYLEHNLYFTGV